MGGVASDPSWYLTASDISTEAWEMAGLGGDISSINYTYQYVLRAYRHLIVPR